MTMRLRAKFGLAVAGVVGVLALAAAAAPYGSVVVNSRPAVSASDRGSEGTSVADAANGSAPIAE